MNATSTSSRRFAAAFGLFAAVAGFAAHSASADDVKTSGFWVEGAVVQGVEDGQLVFRSPRGGEVRRPWGAIEGLRLEAHPELAAGDAQLAAGEPAAAMASYQRVTEDARTPWARAIALGRRVAAASAAGRGDVAVQSWVALAKLEVDDVLVVDPPLASASALPADVRGGLRRSIERDVPRLPESRRDAGAALLDALNPGEAAAASPATSPVINTPARDGNDVLLPVVLDADDTISVLLLSGDFARAEAAARRALNAAGGTSRELFQLGVALREQAEAANDEAGFKSAGLAFMRVVVHFAGGSRLTDYALVEAAYCHHRFGRDDLARELLDRARNAITEEDDPAYADRITSLLDAIASE